MRRSKTPGIDMWQWTSGRAVVLTYLCLTRVDGILWLGGCLT